MCNHYYESQQGESQTQNLGHITLQTYPLHHDLMPFEYDTLSILCEPCHARHIRSHYVS